jgi:hypothetical protein
VASLTPLRFSWTRDKGNGKNLVPSSPCPPLQSIALGAVGRNVARNARVGESSGQSSGAAGSFLHQCRVAPWVTQVVGQFRSRFQRGDSGVQLSGGSVGSGCKCALCSPDQCTFE